MLIDSIFKQFNLNNTICREFNTFLQEEYQQSLEVMKTKSFTIQLGFLLDFFETKKEMFISANNLSYIVIDKSIFKPLGIIPNSQIKNTCIIQLKSQHTMKNFYEVITLLIKKFIVAYG